MADSDSEEEATGAKAITKLVLKAEIRKPVSIPHWHSALSKFTYSAVIWKILKSSFAI